MRIAIDLQSCQTDSRDRGIGRYAMSLVAALSRLLRDDELVICLDMADSQRLREVRKQLRLRNVNGTVSVYGYPYSEVTESSVDQWHAAGLIRTQFFKSIEPDVVLITSHFEYGTCYSAALDWSRQFSIPTAVIAYDLIPLLFPEKYLPKGSLIAHWYHEKLKEFVKFNLFLAISESTRQDLMKCLGLSPDKIKVIGGGLDSAFAERSCESDGAETLEALGVREPFVLMVSHGDWRKNALGALQIFADLPEHLIQSHQLVMTQIGDDVRRALEGEYRRTSDRVRVLGKVTDEVLALLYSRCKVFFYPSLYEGFGFPVLEAMAAGAPALSSCLASLPEVVHQPRMLFDPRDRTASAAILCKALEDDGFRSSLVSGAKEHALGFTWERCARATLEALGHCVRLPQSGPSTDWPDEREIGVLAGACLDAGDRGERALEHGLSAIVHAKRRRILVDISEIIRLNAKTGVQRVTRNFCTGLADLARKTGDFCVEPFRWTGDGIRYARDYARRELRIDCIGEDDFLQPQPGDLVFMLDSSWWSPERFDELHERVWETGGEVVWMVYDLIPIRYPETCEPAMPPTFEAWLTHAVSTADGFLCISEATRQDLESFIDRVSVQPARRPWSRSVCLGCDLDAGQISDPSPAVRETLAAVGKRLMFVALGTVEPRKDYPTIIRAFEQLWADGIDAALVLIGSQGWNVERIVERIRSHPEQGSRLFWLQGVSDGDIHTLLKQATGLVQASLSEGFGLPVVEAGRVGVPLVLSDIAVFHEVAGSDAHYFPAGDEKALAAILKEHSRTGQWKSPRSLKVFTWEQASMLLTTLLLSTSG
jgi:glycosyltransferase involved in cell wall biosynthesis